MLHRSTLTALSSLALIAGFSLATGEFSVQAAEALEQQAQKQLVTGTVVDSNGQPVVGANVFQQGTTNGVMTDANGNFSIMVTAGSVIEVSFIGYKTQTFTANTTNVRIVLQDDAEFLNESVVVGYGIQKKENLTGAVASVDVGKALQGRPIADVGRGLQGSTPGLSVRVGTAEVGSDPIIRIRGQVGSLNGSAQPLILLDNVEIPSLNLVNPDDVESISVLKDAASSSIYGAKAAFGVILITTKKGSAESDHVSVSYSGNVAFANMEKKYEMGDVEALHYTVEAAERVGTYDPVGAFWLVDRAAYNAAVAYKEKYGNSTQDSPLTYGRDWYVDGSNRKIGVRTYDPYHYLVRKNAPSQSHNVSISGNRGATDYNISLAYLNQTGMNKTTDNDYYERYNANTRVSTQINKWLKVHSGMMFTKSTKAWPFATNSTTADVWYYVYRWGPTYPLIDTDESGNDVRTAAYEFGAANKAATTTKYTSVNGGATITPLKNWDINIDYTYANNNVQTRQPGTTFTGGDTWSSAVNMLDSNGAVYEVPNEWADYNKLGNTLVAKQLKNYTYQPTSFNRIYQDSYTSQRQTWNITSDYALNLFGDHQFNFLLGFNSVSYDYTGVWGQKMDLIDISNPQFALATGTQTSGGSQSWSSTAGFFGRINYNYKEKYLLEANLRYDGSSKFPTDMQWRWFPSASAGWRVMQEPFMAFAKNYLTAWKLRASWGSIGDQSVPGSLYIPTMGATSSKGQWLHDDILDVSFSTPGLVASDITWQKIETLNLGTDMTLFGQLDLTFEWYQRTTKDMIVPMEGVGYNIGASAPSGNYGELRTRGWELQASWGHRFENGINLHLTGSISDAKTKITEYGTQANSITGWYKGKTYGEIWGYKVDRLFQNDDFARDASGKLIVQKDAYGRYYQYAEGKKYATQGKITSGNLISGPGDVKFKDLNNDGKIDNGKQLVDDHGDLSVIGNTTPRYEYSFRIDADWKGFDLSVFLQGVGKRDMWGSSSMTLPGFNTADGAMAKAFTDDFWYETYNSAGEVIDANYDAKYPRAANCGNSSVFNMVVNDRYLLNMAYLRIKNITFGYTLPSKLTRKAYISKARFYVSLENFFTFDHLHGLPVDPEIIAGYSYLNTDNYNSGRAGVGSPAFKTASFGVQVTF